MGLTFVMPHGDFSDYAALFSAVSGLSTIFAPATVATFSVGPLKPLFDNPTDETLAALRFAGGLFMYFAFTLFVVRWNTLNGKAAALGLVFAAINTAMLGLGLDK